MRIATEAEVTRDMIGSVCSSKRCAGGSEEDETGKDTSGLRLRRLGQDVSKCLSTNNSMTVELSGCHDKVLGF